MCADVTYKLIAAGDGGVGKTTLLKRYVEGTFDLNTHMTIGVEIHKKTIEFNKGLVADLQLWDFGGQERFRFFLDSFVMGANAAILMFDLTRVSSLENLDEWVDICRKYDPNLPILLVGSKLDLEEMISVDMEDALKMKEKHHCIDFLKVSSKSGHNVHKVFELLTYYLFNKNQLKDKVAIQT